jgi:hypothetical protein
MSGSSSYTYTPLGRSVKTILGSTNDLELELGLTPLYDLNSTLNKKYSVAVQAPSTHPQVKYFGIGIGGVQNVSGTNLSQPQEVSELNMDLYTPLPFRVVPAAQDLDPTTRALYRMRVPKVISGANYICYYLKVLNLAAPSASYTQRDPTTGVETPYTLDYSNLSPTPPPTPVNGQVSSSSMEINVSAASTLPLSGTEVIEAVSALYGGDLRYAKISEIGIYTGTDASVAATDSNGQAFNYTEALMAQLHIQSTLNGVDMSSPTASFGQQFVFAGGSIVLI